MTVSMNRLVGTVRGFEQLGDAQVVKLGNPTGDMSVDKSAQAKADAEVVGNVVDLIRKTEGMGGKHADLALEKFGELANAGKPITGREVAAIVTEVIEGLQGELDFPTGEKTLEDFGAFMGEKSLAKLEPKDFDPNLGRVNDEQTVDFVNREIREEPKPPTTAAAPRTTPEIDQARADLEKNRDTFGGAPHYPNGRPQYETERKTFFGLPRESCQAWCQKTLDNKWKPAFFWKAVAKGFGVDSSSGTQPTKFERCALYLESMKRLDANRDAIAAAFRRSEKEGKDLFCSVTRLACHVGDNGGPEGMIRNIDNALELFKTQYAKAKETNTIEQFFDQGCQGVCFEDRITKLTEYAMQVEATQNPEMANLARVIDHNPDDDMLTAISREMGALDDYGTWDDTIRPHLISTMVGMERGDVDENGGPLMGEDNAPLRRAITVEDIDRLRKPLNDIIFFED